MEEETPTLVMEHQEQAVVRLILLRQRSEYLLAKVTELDEEPIYLLERCYEVSEEGELIAFPKHSSQRDIFLTSDVILTILEPSQTLLDKYNA